VQALKNVSVQICLSHTYITAGAMSFLAHEGFDFNKWVRQGVAYMPLKQYEQRMSQVRWLPRSPQVYLLTGPCIMLNKLLII